jgi:transcription antitermination factor NusG
MNGLKLKLNWYVLYTASRAEKQAQERLNAEGVETYLPLHLSPRRWSDRIKLVEVPLFTSYVFVHTSDEILRTLVRKTGISRIVFYSGKPAIIRDKEIEAIKEFLEKAKGKECEFLVNDEVQITSGLMKDVSGKVRRATKEYLFLSLEQIGIIIKIKTDQVLKK